MDDELVARVIVASRIRDKNYRAESIRAALAEARRDERRKVLRILIRESCLGEHAAGTTCRLCLMLAEDAAGEEVTK